MKGFIRATLYISLFILMAIVSSYVTFWVLGSKKTVTVPDLRGRSLVEANKELLSKRLYLKIGGEDFSTDVPTGYIIRQDIPPDNKIKEGRTIRVIISKGPRIYYMPAFVGLNLDEAKELAMKKNIKIRKILKVHSDSFDKGIVIAQRPAPEEKGSDSITLLLSRGPFKTVYVCPDFTTMSLDEAKTLADRMGIELELIDYGSLIAEQTPPAGSIIKRGDSIKLRLKYEEEQEIRWL
ncbi:MAG TPA: PASTA domain-containing protein [Nitrospirae bacterium]|nr:PASTA domain-containing protein [Nitrospirota bacterium]